MGSRIYVGCSEGSVSSGSIDHRPVGDRQRGYVRLSCPRGGAFGCRPRLEVQRLSCDCPGVDCEHHPGSPIRLEMPGLACGQPRWQGDFGLRPLSVQPSPKAHSDLSERSDALGTSSKHTPCVSAPATYLLIRCREARASRSRCRLQGSHRAESSGHHP